MNQHIIVNPEGLTEEGRAECAAKYLRTHGLTVQFLGEEKFEHTDEFNMEYARTLCHIGVVKYAKLFSLEIPNDIHTRKSLSNKIKALELLVAGDVVPEVAPVVLEEPAPKKEDFIDLISEEPSVETTEGNKSLKPDLETKVIVDPTVETKVVEPKAEEPEVPEDLKCPHCNATARTKKSYLNNHGTSCVRYVKTK